MLLNNQVKEQQSEDATLSKIAYSGRYNLDKTPASNNTLQQQVPAVQLYASEPVQIHTLNEEKETVKNILDAISSDSEDEECKD